MTYVALLFLVGLTARDPSSVSPNVIIYQDLYRDLQILHLHFYFLGTCCLNCFVVTVLRKKDYQLGFLLKTLLTTKLRL